MKRQQMHALQAIVDKIDVFKGLTPEEVERLLRVCSHTTFEAGEVVFTAGDASDEMVIVLQGKLSPRSRAGTVLGEITAGSCCGEMGLFTGEARTATVVAEAATTGFRIQRQDLMVLFRTDTRMHIKMLQNIVALLSRRLASTDQQIETYARRTEQLEEQVGGGLGDAAIGDDEEGDDTEKEPEAGEEPPDEEG